MPNGCEIPFTGLTRQYNTLREETLSTIDSVLSSGHLMNGEYTSKFEQWLAQRNHVRYAITCHSGTQALEIIAEFSAEYTRSYRIQDTNPVALLPSVSYVATANALVRAGWDIHFVDVDRYGIMNFAQINHVHDYQAVVPVGLYGAAISGAGPATQWNSKINSREGVVIEDAAQHWLSDNCQRIGLASAISFDPTKNLANYSNGGAVVTDNPDVAFYAQGWRSNNQKGNCTATAGTNSRMSEIDCATLLIKSRYLDKWQNRRRSIASYWTDRLKDSVAVSLIDYTNQDKHSFHKFVINVDNRDQLHALLAADGIETKVHYNKPLHELSQFHQYPGPGYLSTASALCRRVLSLPIYPELTDNEVEYIIDRVLAHV
jgi:dTDP-4-amino-4,6-dideoxygalactose transaminase